jgi:hypothetical protein
MQLANHWTWLGKWGTQLKFAMGGHNQATVACHLSVPTLHGPCVIQSPRNLNLTTGSLTQSCTRLGLGLHLVIRPGLGFAYRRATTAAFLGPAVIWVFSLRARIGPDFLTRWSAQVWALFLSDNLFFNPTQGMARSKQHSGRKNHNWICLTHIPKTIPKNSLFRLEP